MNPSFVCMATEHCFPTPNGIPYCQGPIGPGMQYDACLDPSECDAALNCVDTGDQFALPCCMQWCISSATCPAGSSCVALNPAVYVGGTQYGVCYDGLGGCL